MMDTGHDILTVIALGVWGVILPFAIVYRLGCIERALDRLNETARWAAEEVDDDPDPGDEAEDEAEDEPPSRLSLVSGNRVA